MFRHSTGKRPSNDAIRQPDFHEFAGTTQVDLRTVSPGAVVEALGGELRAVVDSDRHGSGLVAAAFFQNPAVLWTDIAKSVSNKELSRLN
jgi:hypothetical protein